MKVKAREGLRVPKENAPRQYITAAEAVTVPDTVYYTRRIMDGDLIEVADDTATVAEKAGAKNNAKGA